MKTVKTFLTTKVISDISELDYGDVAIFNNELCFRKFNGDISIIDCFDEATYDFVVTIYGVRVSLSNGADKIERVLVERHISLGGEIRDVEKIGDDSGLSFKAENHTFDNGLFSNLEPFKSMQDVTTRIDRHVGNDEEFIDGKFVKLPIFFKNKEKRRTINSVNFDYYLISPFCFDDFYPVESHKKGSVYVDCIYIESDWRQQEYEQMIYPSDYGSYVDTGNFDGMYSLMFNDKLINDNIFYCYLYYIYFIKTANFKPFSDINYQKKSVFITGARGFVNFDDYESSMLTYLYDLNGGSSSDLSDVLTAEEIAKYPWYLKLSDGKNNNDFFENIFFEDCFYNINGYTGFTNGIGYRDLVSVVARPRFFPQKQQGCVYFLVSELLELQCLNNGETNFRSNQVIVSSDADPYIIKLIPFFYDETNVYGSGFVREDVYIANNTYTDSGNFCIDHLRNILPVFYNAYIPFDETNTTTYFNDTCRQLAYENYNVVINSGSASGLLSTMSYKKNLCVCDSTSVNIPYYSANHVAYLNINQYSSNTFNINIVYRLDYLDYNYNSEMNSFVVLSDGGGTDNFVVKTNTTSIGGGSISTITSESMCYLYKGAFFAGNDVSFEWCSMSILKLSQPYENYNYANDDRYGNNFFVSRLIYYPYK